MTAAASARGGRAWPALRLRTILLGVLLFAALMPAAGMLFLRVYENTLVRRTEAELVAQGAALAAVAGVLWPGGDAGGAAPDRYQPEQTTIDLSDSQVLPQRPAARRHGLPVDPGAVSAATILGPAIDRTTRTTLASIVLLDGHGRVVRGPAAGDDLSFLPEVRSALAGQSLTVLRRSGDYRQHHFLEWLSRASALRLHHARPIRVGGQVRGVLLLSRSPRALYRGLYEDRAKFVLGGLGIVAALVVLAGLVSRGVTRPIERLSAASRAVATGAGDIPPTPRIAAAEIRGLYADFRAMAEASARRSRYLRDFAAAVSHEFKTPLAGIAGAVELLQDHFETMSPAERARFLGNISADTARLSHLVTRLLDLARADMATPEAGAAVDVSDPVRRVVDGFSGIELALGLPPDLPPVAVPAATIETVLTVLLENSRQAGARRIEVAARTTPEAVKLTVADDGPGVAETDRERLFEPFFTSRRAEGGTGLGLPIARSLLDASGGRIAAIAAARGACFEVSLPLARTVG